ncbi:uncharacterized protein LOC118752117, partial [Rhagoletis pomonella]|uniref:uncharacterized protein LOC118752117 n=1 Tax=Rhagoletis pomonella TaxID=28610 RepID=UPI0017870578
MATNTSNGTQERDFVGPDDSDEEFADARSTGTLGVYSIKKSRSLSFLEDFLGFDDPPYVTTSSPNINFFQNNNAKLATPEQNKSFISLCASIIGENYSGDPLSLASFIDKIARIEELSDESLTTTFIAFLKSKLEGKARESLPTQISSVSQIKEALSSKIKPDDSKVVAGKIAALKVHNNNYSDFAKQVEELADALERSLIIEGMTQAKAHELAVEQTINVCRLNSRSDMVKSILASSTFSDSKDVVAKMIVEHDNIVKERQVLAFRYEGEWYNNKKHGYGVTTFRDGSFEEGKYKNNILITSQKKKHLFLARSRKFRDRITIAVNSAQRALKMAMQRSDIAISRTSTATDRAQNADVAADQARIDCEIAVRIAREFAPDFKPSVLERFEKLRYRNELKFTPSTKNNNPSSYSGNLVERHKNASTLQEMRESDLNKRIESKIHLQNSMQSQRPHITPQTDFVNLVNQQSYSGSNALDSMYSLQDKKNEQRLKQYQDSTQVSQLSRKNNTVMSDLAENNNLAHGNRMEPGETTLKNNRNNHYSNNYSANANKTDDYTYHTFDGEQTNLQTLFNQQHFQAISPQIPTHTFPDKNYLFSRDPSQHQDVLGATEKQTRPPSLHEMNQKLSIDYFDHYKRPPSRDSSIDRYTRAASRVNESAGSRKASVDKCIPLQIRDLLTPNGEGSYSRDTFPRSAITQTNPNSQLSLAEEQISRLAKQPFEDVVLHQQSLGQDIIPSPMSPKRTESLYIPPKKIDQRTTPINAFNYAGSKQKKELGIECAGTAREIRKRITALAAKAHTDPEIYAKFQAMETTCKYSEATSEDEDEQKTPVSEDEQSVGSTTTPAPTTNAPDPNTNVPEPTTTNVGPNAGTENLENQAPTNTVAPIIDQ